MDPIPHKTESPIHYPIHNPGRGISVEGLDERKGSKYWVWRGEERIWEFGVLGFRKFKDRIWEDRTRARWESRDSEQKSYPPDFDRSGENREPENLRIKERMILPTIDHSVNTARTAKLYLARARSLTLARKTVSENRFSAELIAKNDWQSSDQTMESGAAPNFEPRRATDEAVDATEEVKREAEEMGEAMHALENRVLDSIQEMDIMAASDEESMRSRHAGVGTAEMLEAVNKSTEEKQKDLTKEDDAVLRSVVFQNSHNLVPRIDDGDEFDDEDIEDYFFEQTSQPQEMKRNEDSVRAAPAPAPAESDGPKPKLIIEEKVKEIRRSKVAQEEAAIESKIVEYILDGQWEFLCPNSGLSVEIRGGHLCVDYHEEVGYRVWEWHGHCIIYEDGEGYTPEYTYGNYFELLLPEEELSGPVGLRLVGNNRRVMPGLGGILSPIDRMFFP